MPPRMLYLAVSHLQGKFAIVGQEGSIRIDRGEAVDLIGMIWDELTDDEKSRVEGRIL